MKLALCMIVKDEEKVVKRALNSIKSIIDYWVIIDTGSKDSTISIIQEELKSIPGELHNSEWKNFAFNRTELMQKSKDKADYFLIMDADETFEINNFDINTLDKDSYYIKVKGDFVYKRKLLVNGHLNWEYIGVAHEYIYSNEEKTISDLDSIYSILYPKQNNKHIERNYNLLLDGIEKESNNSRYMFYLGESCRDLEKYEEGINWYKKRIEFNGWEEEIYYSLYQIGWCYENLKNIEEAKKYYLKAFEYRPIRAETLYELARLSRWNNEYNQAMLYAEKGLKIKIPNDSLFIKKDIYDYKILFEFSISSYYVGRYKDSINASRKLLNSNVPEYIKDQVRKNFRFSIQKSNISPLNKFFDKIYCICRTDTYDKTKRMIDRFKHFGIDAEIYQASPGLQFYQFIMDNIKDKNYSRVDYSGEIGATLSHLSLIKRAKDYKYKNIFIFEHENMFVKDFNEKCGEYLGCLNEDWDIIYFFNQMWNGWNDKHKFTNTNKWFYSYGGLCANAYGINRKFYDVILDYYKDKFHCIDLAYLYLQEEQKYEIYTSYPNLCCQEKQIAGVSKYIVELFDKNCNMGNYKFEDFV